MNKNKKEREPQAVVAGTVFRNTGHALRGAEVSVTSSERGKKGEWKGFSDSRGEFAVRIPAGGASYTVIIKAEGFRTQQKSVTVSADERIDLSFLMEPK
ncbi:MAG: carboxypeptidase regulatory-like domain-containing protein [Bryobacterales bacterium]|nr:carboxypeptidase regulatory-like domain-containing protein [Bryobacterales bacterium]